jgi:hypothetical protein
MRIVVVGGSNSVSKEGYVGHFADKMSEKFDDVEIVNISSGGTTSLTSLVGIGQLTGDVDLFVIEYSLNDTGHLNHREGGGDFKTQFLQIVFGYIKERFPKSRILPLILASEPFYDLNVPNSVYESEVRFFSENGIYYHDMRRELFHMFGGQPPYFLYSDIAHFHRGFASSIIGRTLALSAIWLLDAQSLQNIAGNVIGTLCPSIHSASELAKSDPSRISSISNRHMSLKYVEVSRGNSLSCTVSGWPVCLYIASDSQHVDLNVEVDDRLYTFGTRHLDCREGKFILTSVPLVLDQNFMQHRRGGEVDIRFTLGGRSPVWTFDCLESHAGSTEVGRVRVVAIATIDTQLGEETAS